MVKNTITLPIIFFFLSFGRGYAQSDDPRGEGQYMDYTTQSMPESPSASAFNAVGEIQVNHAKGIPDISIPIYTYEVDGVKVPISLSYDASGIKVSQMSTAVGLGWSLVAGGQISRTVRSKPDEEDNNGWFDNGYIRANYYVGKDPNSTAWQKDMKGVKENLFQTGLVKLRDHNPDLFSYSLLGHSGTYIHDTNRNVIKEKKDGLSIVSLSNAYADLDARDLEGNFYLFEYEDTERSRNKNLFDTGSDVADDFIEWENGGLPIVTAWKLSNISTKNGKEINFGYESVDMVYEIFEASSHVTVGTSCKGQDVKSVASTDVTHRFSTQLLKEISSPHSNIKVEFEYADDSNLPVSVWKRRLVKITVSDIATGDRREFHLGHLRFPGDPRLQLESVQEKAYKNGVIAEKPPYSFEYEGGNLPPKNSLAQDLYGYYNLANSNSTLVPDFFTTHPLYQDYFDMYSADRSLNVNGLKRGTLSQITYPTGGKTLFSYEPNVDNLFTLNGYRGGLRVKEIKNLDENDSVASHRNYQYSDLNGADLKAQSSLWLSKTEGDTKSYFSSPIRIPGDGAGYKTGYFYGSVAVVSHGGNSTQDFKKEYRYKENPYNRQSYDHVLESETIFKGTSSNRLKIVEYEYAVISNDSPNPEIVSWNVIGDMDCYSPNGGGWSRIGYTIMPRFIHYSGNYAYLPTRIATTDFPEGGATNRITVVKDITYDSVTLLKKTEITDLQLRREESPPGTVSYVTNDGNAERITVAYTYPFDVPDFSSLPNFPQGTVVRQEVTTTKNGQTAQTGGKAYDFDAQGNIKTIYSFEKGQGSNSSSLTYVPSTYEERTGFVFSAGYPVQVTAKGGLPTTYIWNLKGNVPVAKIEGVHRGVINQNLIAQLENASFSQLPALLTQLRTVLSSYGNAFLTTFAHTPMGGVEAIIDPKGNKTAYEYDAFGRLLLVRDAEGNILNETEYNYALD